VDVNSADYDGRTALHIAASEGHVAVVAALLKAGADCTISDRFGSMAIHDAQRYKHSEVERLIRDGANVNFDDFIVTAARRSTSIDHDHGASNRELLAAAETGDLGEIKRLRNKRANLLGADYDGRTALHIAAKNGHLHIVRYLVQMVAGVNVNLQDKNRSTPYTEAKKAQQEEVADFLLAHGASEMDNAGVGAELCKSAYAGDIDAIKQIVKEGKSLRSADYDGRTALHLAAAGGHAEIIEFLINPGRGQEGININVTDRWGGTALDDAKRCGHKNAERTLRRLGAIDIIHATSIAPEDDDCLSPTESDALIQEIDMSAAATGASGGKSAIV
jgi:ankyrin repeat protein